MSLLTTQVQPDAGACCGLVWMAPFRHTCVKSLSFYACTLHLENESFNSVLLQRKKCPGAKLRTDFLGGSHTLSVLKAKAAVRIGHIRGEFPLKIVI